MNIEADQVDKLLNMTQRSFVTKSLGVLPYWAPSLNLSSQIYESLFDKS